MRQHTIQLLPITLAGIEAVNANSDITFGRHTHDQFGIGLMDSGGQKSLSVCLSAVMALRQAFMRNKFQKPSYHHICNFIQDRKTLLNRY